MLWKGLTRVMAKSVKLQVLTPSRMFYEGDIELVIARTLTGDEGFMAGHSWACKLLVIGELWIQEAGVKDFKYAAISGGFIDVKEDIIVYTDAAEWSEEIDTQRALVKKAKMEEWLKEHQDDPTRVARAKKSITKQLTRIKVAAGGVRRKR